MLIACAQITSTRTHLDIDDIVRVFFFFCQSLRHHFGQIFNVVKLFSAVVIDSYRTVIAHNRNYLKQINIFFPSLWCYAVCLVLFRRSLWCSLVRFLAKSNSIRIWTLTTQARFLISARIGHPSSENSSPPPVVIIIVPRSLCFPPPLAFFALLLGKIKQERTLLFLLLLFER